MTSLVNATISPQQTLLQNSQSTDQATVSALASVQSSLSSLQSAVQSITTGNGLLQSSAQSSDSSVFTATADSGAVNGTYQVQVQTIAQANTIESQAFSSANASVGTGAYTISAGGSSFTVNLDSTDDTVSGLASAINNASGNTGVSATIVNGTGGSYLLLSATQTGTANAVSMSASGLNFTTVQGASDATGTVDGLAFDSASNVVTNVLSNVALNLQSASPNSTQTLTVAPDTNSAASAVQNFVSAYNAALQLITTDTAYTPPASGASTTSNTGSAGPLLGDLGIESVARQLQSITGGSTGSTTNPYTQLSQIGITFNSDGTMALNTGTLTSALQQNPNAAQSLFSDPNGIGTQLNTMLTNSAGAGGTIDSETQSIQTTLSNISNQLTQLNAQSTQLTSQYNAEFNAMDTIVAAYKNTANLLTELYTSNPTNSTGSTSSSSSG